MTTDSEDLTDLIAHFESITWNFGIDPDRRDKLQSEIIDRMLSLMPTLENVWAQKAYFDGFNQAVNLMTQALEKERNNGQQTKN